MNHNYHRYEGETDQQLIFRICQEKDSIGTWSDVRDILNDLLGEDSTESRYRKQYQSFNKMLQANQSKFIDSEQAVETINLARRELEKERKKLQTEKIEYNRWLREQARDEMVVEEISEAIKSCPAVEFPKNTITKEMGNRKKAGLLCLADAHYGVQYEIKGLFGEVINAYSPEIFEDRMWYLFAKVCEIVAKEELTELNIFYLGDELEGMLRTTSQLMKLRYGVIDSAVRFANFMVEWLNKLSEKILLKVYYCVDSNHNQLRLLGQPKNAFKDENMSKVIFEIIKGRLSGNQNITVMDNPTGYPYAMLAGYTVLGIHGEVKNLGSAIDDFSRTYGVPIDYIVGGHKHHRENVEVGQDREAISVGSIIGVDGYSMSLNKTSSASVTFLVFESLLGKTTQYDIKFLI